MKFLRRTSKPITSNFLIELLKDRNVLPEDQEAFFNPTKENEEDPLLLDHIEEGVELLLKYLPSGTIYLPLDPDVDGYTSASLFYNYLTNIAADNEFNFNIIYHVPDGKEHGLATIMDWFPEDGVNKLVVCLDSSSNDYEQHKELKNRGYDVLVIDHHEASHYSEDAIVINNQLSQDYPNKDLSGVGVVYKFFELLEQKIKIGPNARPLDWYLDLVALGVISDVMKMIGLENRYICDWGLSHINNTFFQELVHKQCYSLFGIREDQWTNFYYTNGEVTQIKVAFYITPLINALIRVGNMIEKERLFQAFITPNLLVPSTKRGERGMEETICTQSVRNCTNAKSRQTKERDRAAELLDIQIANNCLDDNKILVLNADDLNIPNTLTGLCAMGVAAQHKKPVLLGRISPDGKELSGSIRNFDNSPLIDLKKFLSESGLMTFVEGHSNAAGYSIPVGNIDRLVEYANDKLADLNFNEGYYEADFIVNGNNEQLIELIREVDNGKKLWGQGNPEVVVIVENITIDASAVQVMGANLDTVKFMFNGITYIKFKAKDLIEEFKSHKGKISITVAGMPVMNYWMGRGTPQIQIKEIEIKDSSIFDF